MKRDVIVVFAVIFVLTITLSFFQIWRLNGITGYSVLSDNFSQNVENSVNSFRVQIINYKLFNDEIKVFYELSELEGKSQLILIEYALEDNQRKILDRGIQKVVLEEWKTISPIISVPFSETNKDFRLYLRFYDELSNFVEKEIIFSSTSISGFSVQMSDQNYRVLPFAILGFAILLLIAIVIVYNRLERRKKLDIQYGHEYRGKNLIKLDI